MPLIRGPTLAILALATCLCFVLAVHLDFVNQATFTRPFTTAAVSPDRLDSPPPPEYDIHPRILLVSAFFPLKKSKHSLADYEHWLSRFLGQINTDLYLFCPPEIASLITRLRGDLPVTINTTYSSPFDTPPLLGLEPRYEEMHAWDPERSIHSPELYAVWNAKPFFLEQGLAQASSSAENTTTHYDFAFWTDAGSLRSDHPYRTWPAPGRVSRFFHDAAQRSGTPENEIIFFPFIWPPDHTLWMWKEDDGPTMTEALSEGSFFGGKGLAVSQYAQSFYAYHDRWLEERFFVGKDQTLINALIFLYSSHFFGVLVNDWPAKPGVGAGRHISSPFGACGNSWWYYEWWLAESDEREKMADKWVMPPYSGDGPARDIDLLHERPDGSMRCRDSQLVTGRELLQRALGRWWWPPHAALPWGAGRPKSKIFEGKS